MYRTFALFVLLCIVSLYSYSQPASAQAFEGSLHFARESMNDTIYYTYHIKGNFVRIDELDRRKKLIKYILIDKENRTMKAINPSLKLFTVLPVKPYVPISDSNFQVIKSENSKEIHGFRCKQWRVRNEAQNTEITYWVAHDGFDFFCDLMKIINSVDKSLSYFLQLDNTEGILPLEVTERTLLRINRTKICVKKIDKKTLPDSMFTVPENFTAFDR